MDIAKRYKKFYWEKGDIVLLDTPNKIKEWKQRLKEMDKIEKDIRQQIKYP